MKHLVNISQADYSVLVFIPDSSSTVGAGKTGLTEASIDLAYSRVETDNDVTVSDVAPAALSALTDAHIDWGFEEVDATNAPGLYRLDIADAVFASGAWSAVVTITDAASNNVPPTNIEFQLVGLNSTVPATVNGYAAGQDPATLLLAATADGVSLTNLFTAMVSMMCGKVAVTDNGTTRTLSFKKQDGTTESISVTVAEADGARANTGTIS